MIEAVVFDLDGVLIGSEPVWEEVRRDFVASHGGHWAPDARYPPDPDALAVARAVLRDLSELTPALIAGLG